jgi:hypothetical protein
MPRGPKGEKRHADTVKNAMLIARIATGECQSQKFQSEARPALTVLACFDLQWPNLNFTVA